MLVNATGWMPDAILDGLTLGDVADLNEYWQGHPPIQWMVQGYFGIKPPDEAVENNELFEGAEVLSPEQLKSLGY